MDAPDAAVVPLDPGLWSVPANELEPWKLLATGRGLLVRWDTPAAQQRTTFGPPLGVTSELVRHVGTVLQRAGTDLARVPSDLVRVELPAGSTMADLVPAVGGGFRAMVRGAGSSTFTGQARLVPVSGAAIAGGGAGAAAVGLAPVLAVMALSVGAEMLARHQQDKKLATITGIVARIDQRNADRDVAELRSAEQAITLGSAALLDQVAIPSSIGLGSACDRVRVVMHQGRESLARWEEAADRLPERDGTISYSKLLHELGIEDDPRRLARVVANLYLATVLDSRAKVLLAAEAALANPTRPLDNLHRQLSADLAANAETHDRLREVLWALAEPRLRSGRTAPTPQARAAITAFDRTLTGLSLALSRAPDAPPLMTSTGRQVLELARTAEDQLQPVVPAR